jgi:hypothetical protein
MCVAARSQKALRIASLCMAAVCAPAFAAGPARFTSSDTRMAANTHDASAPAGVSCGTLTITQSSTQTVTPGNSTSCNGGAPAHLHTDNSYFRAFDLTALGAPGGLDVCEVQLGVEQAVSGGGTGQPIVVNLYTSSQPFPMGFPGSLTAIGTSSASVPDSATGTVLSVPVTGSAPAGSQLVVEIFTPNGAADGNSFYIGSNADAQTGPSYLLAEDCSVTAPMPTSDIGVPNMHIVLNAIGNPASDVIFANGFDGAVGIESSAN